MWLCDYANVDANQWPMGLPCSPIGQLVRNLIMSVQFCYIALYMPLHSKVLSAMKIHGKLEIWDKAQRESAWRPKSEWGEKFRGVKFPRYQSHVARTQMH